MIWKDVGESWIRFVNAIRWCTDNVVRFNRVETNFNPA